MKFKVLFITFNIVLFLSFLTIFLLPFFILDGTFMIEFWSKNWYFAFLFLTILAIVNIVFLSHWKMLSLLEKEDWPGLAAWLENEIFNKRKFSERNIALLCDSLLLLGDHTTMKKLETTLRKEKPVLLAKTAGKFAAAGLLSKSWDEIYSLASEFENAKGANTAWLSFYASFSLHLSGKFREAAPRFAGMAESSKDPLVAALGGYMVAQVLPGKPGVDEKLLASAAEMAKKRITAKYSRKSWDSFIEESKAEMQVVVLGKLINEAGNWLFG